MGIFMEINNEEFQLKTQSYFKYFKPFVDHMKTVVDANPDVSEYLVFNNYINFVQWPVRKLEYSFVLDQIVNKVSKDSIILDAGCGVTPLPFLLGTFSENVFAIDFSCDDIKLMQNIKEKNNFSGSNNVNFNVQNICKLTFNDNFFDFISCVSVLEHIDFPYYVEAFSELYRVLKPDGTLVSTMDFWLGSSRTTTMSSGGFTKEDIHELFDIFGDQLNYDGYESLDNITKEDIDLFWSTHYDEDLDYSIREYVAIGFTITKHTDPTVVDRTLQKLLQYQKDKSYSVLLERNNFISIIEKDREERLQIIRKLSEDMELIQIDRAARLELINRQHFEIERLTKELKEVQSNGI